MEANRPAVDWPTRACLQLCSLHHAFFQYWYIAVRPNRRISETMHKTVTLARDGSLCLDASLT